MMRRTEDGKVEFAESIDSHVNRRGSVSSFATSPGPSLRSTILNQELAAARMWMCVSVENPADC